MSRNLVATLVVGFCCLIWFSFFALVGVPLGKAALSTALMAVIGLPALLIIISADDKDAG